MKNLFGVLKYVNGYWRYGIWNIVFNILSVIFSLFSLTLIMPFLNLLFQPDSDLAKILSKGPPDFHFSVTAATDYFYYHLTTIITSQGRIEALVLLCIVTVILITLKNLTRYLAMFFLAPIRNGVVKDLRNSIFRKSLELPLSYYSDERKGDIMSRVTMDVMSSLEMIFREPINIILFLIALVMLSPQLTLFVFVLLPVAGGVIALVGKSLRRTSTQAKGMLGTLFSIMEETLGGLRIIKGFNAEETIDAKFRKENQDYTKLMIKTYRKVDLPLP
jgi:subfamily B ATP-binding cassette protein MsbA